ncbi:MAG: aminotransferase class I/II-fold pyridoxal phosphate-dependent enzyme, partial [Bacteroidota bacterium]
WTTQTVAPLIKEGANLLVSRTFSKIYGMAGLRIGFLMGPGILIKELENQFTLGFPGNMPNSLSVAAAIGALQDDNFIISSRQKNATSRENLYASFDQLGLKYLPSTTNFVYFDVVDFPAFKRLMQKHQIVLAGGWPSKPNWARVTIGNHQEMNYFQDRIKGKTWL